jgi:hypothetical protein
MDKPQVFAVALALVASPLAAKTISVAPGPHAQEVLQTALIDAQPGDVVQLAAGRYVLTDGLSLDVDRVTLRGAGPDQSILDFKGQKAAGEGLLVTSDDVVLRGFAVEDARGDAIKSKGADAFRTVLGRAQGFFDFYLQHLSAENDTSSDRGRLVVLRSMAEATRKTGNAVLVDTYAQRTAQRLGVDVASVRTEFKRHESAQRPRRAEPVPNPDEPPDDVLDAVHAPPPTRPSTNELWLLKYILLTPELRDAATAYLDPDWVVNPAVQRILAVHFQTGGDIPGLLGRFEGDGFAQGLITEAATEQREIPEPERGLLDLVRRLRDGWADRQIALNNGRLADPALLDEERLAVLDELRRLREWKRTPLEPLAEG